MRRYHYGAIEAALVLLIARNSSFTYKRKAVDVKTVARELSVRYVLEGSVRKGGNRVRITAQLIDAVTGNHIWADRYDGNLTDVFVLQDEITTKVVAAIEPRPGG
jgi:adenylate cyclase